MSDTKTEKLVAEAREKAEDILVFVRKYRTDPYNYMTTHEELDDDQKEGDWYNAVADTLEAQSEEVRRLREENRRMKDLVGAARMVCQWLDTHEDETEGWEDGAKMCIGALHRRVVEYEEKLSGEAGEEA